MVLGVQWLESLGPKLWDFSKHTMAFRRGDHHVMLAGTATSSSPLLATVDPYLLHELLALYSALSAEPTGLPPARCRSHRIRRKPGTTTVSVRSYRYALLQKEELEWQCAEMLWLGVIKPSSSAFLAPVLLVKKHDGTWWFCVDYRSLNDAAIKDKFPIPVLEELLDELRSAKFFTKLDLRSGYH